MDHIRDDFLAHAALARDQHIGFGRRHRFDQLLDFLHSLALDHGRQPRLRDLEPLLELLRLFSKMFRFAEERLLLERFLDQAEQFLRRIRLADEVIGAALDRFDRVAQRIVRRQNDHLRLRMLLLDLIEHLQSVGVRQLQIEQDHGGRILLQGLQSVRRGGCGFDLITVTAQERLQREQNGPLVVDDQDASIFSGHG